jgi:hypothetical protein
MMERVQNGWCVAALVTVLVMMASACTPDERSEALPPITRTGEKQKPLVAGNPTGDVVAGGQSGTDSSGSYACHEPVEASVAFDERTSLGTAMEVVNRFERLLQVHPKIALAWLADGSKPTTTLVIEVKKWGSRATWLKTGDGASCDDLRIPATLHLTTADGAYDETLEGDFSVADGRPQWQGSYSDAAMDGARIATVRFDWDPLGDWSKAVISGELSGWNHVSDGGVPADASRAAAFSSYWPLPLPTHGEYRRPHAFDDLCSATQDTAPGRNAFTSTGELIGALTGAWVLCSGGPGSAVEHAGIEFADDGTWNHLAAQDGALSQELGFGHEGTFEVIELSKRDHQLNIQRSYQDYEFSEDRGTLRLVQSDADFPIPSYDDVYVRTDLAIGPPRVARARGERGGAPACAEGEAFVQEGFASADALVAALTGSWAVCAGGFRSDAVEIAFTSDGSYRHLDADGETVATGRYEVVDTSDGSGSVYVHMEDDDSSPDGLDGHYGFSARLSDAPIKLELNDDAHTVLSAMP